MPQVRMALDCAHQTIAQAMREPGLQESVLGDEKQKPQNNHMKNKQYLVVTTAHRGVFAGYGKPTTNKTIRLEQARMCVSWSADIKGVVGLASDGPSKSCKVGPAAPAITLQDVTSVMEASKKAEDAWNSQPWN